MIKPSVRVRYAPSPTGNLHIGNARTALFNYLFARHYHGQFIVRVEDTDLNRNDLTTIAQQFADLAFLNLEVDESMQHPGNYGPYRQMERLAYYEKIMHQLLAQKQAYRCFCSPTTLAKMKAKQQAAGHMSFQYNQQCRNLAESVVKRYIQAEKPYCVRFHVPLKKQWTINDLVRGQVHFEADDIGDFVIMKQNKTPSYNFAVVVDDHFMHISHVIRGEEHLSNTPKQIMLYEALGWIIPQFAHLTLIINAKGQKLSKRDRSIKQFINEYRHEGYLPSAIINYLALLGWTPSASEKELFTKRELITIFDPQRWSKSPSTFDEVKMRWLNKKHLQQMPAEAYLNWSQKFLEKYYPQVKAQPASWSKQLLLLLRNEITLGSDFQTASQLFFEPNRVNDQLRHLLHQLNFNNDLMAQFADLMTKVNFQEITTIQQAIKQFGQTHNLKGKKLFMPVRIIATMSDHGPALAATLHLLGQKKVVSNIEAFQKETSNGH